LLRGETRIDSFNNIVGVSDVREAVWKDFSAHDLECRYGAKLALADGVLKAGFGLRDYHGKTDDEPGGKDISIEGAGLLIKYENDDFNVRLEWQREVHDYTLRNQASFSTYDSLVDATENTTDATGRYRYLYLHATHVCGSKDNVYTTALFPSNYFDYGYTDIALGINMETESDGVTMIAPIFGGGSYRGSFNPLQSDDLIKGIELAWRLRGYEIAVSFLRHEGQGDRPYLPATNKLTETIERDSLTINIQSADWKLTLENTKSLHKANATIASPLYAALLGGFGPYNNKRDEDKWSVSLSLPLTEKVTADFSLYHTSRRDQQYNHPEHNYSEKGGFVKIKISV
jgi:hypothetical protein